MELPGFFFPAEIPYNSGVIWFLLRMLSTLYFVQYVKGSVQEPDKSTFIDSLGEEKQNSLSHSPLLGYWREIIQYLRYCKKKSFAGCNIYFVLLIIIIISYFLIFAIPTCNNIIRVYISTWSHSIINSMNWCYIGNVTFI